MPFEQATVIGTGMMGPGIALSLALGGVRATILSRNQDSASAALAKARSHLDLLAEHGLADAANAAAAKDRLDASADFDPSIAKADLVIESAPENMEFKQDLFRRMDALAKPSAVLASNTSGLSITAIASACSKPERVITTHFWNPPHLMPLVEIVKGEKTDHDLAMEIRDLLVACGKVAIVIKRDTPGQLGNRLQIALIREAINIVQEGIADVEDVDLAAKNGFGLRLPVYGILEHQDIVGLDMALGIVDYISTDLYTERKAPSMMRGLVQDGKLGPKTGQGFYDWTKRDVNAVKQLRDDFVLDFMKRWARR